MNDDFKQAVMRQWETYFPGAELPLVYYYTDTVTETDRADTRNEDRCLIGNLNRVRQGHPFIYSAKTPGCPGGKRYAGYTQTLMPHFDYFLSCGIPGKVEGERYKKSPELVQAFLKTQPPFEAPARYLLFKRWDMLSKGDTPLAVIFFATADVLSGLFTLANFDYADTDGVITPMGSGCATIIGYPLREASSGNPRCVLGMFDVSARPCVPDNTLTFTVPMQRFETMVHHMDESFLTTQSWRLVQKRMQH